MNKVKEPVDENAEIQERERGSELVGGRRGTGVPQAAVGCGNVRKRRGSHLVADLGRAASETEIAGA
jgi:hypothetical protein